MIFRDEKGISFDKMDFPCFSSSSIYNFLMWLKDTRSSSTQTLNLRLSAIKFKDIAADENMVGNISRRIIAAPFNHQFLSLFEINQAIKTELNRYINRPFQKLKDADMMTIDEIHSTLRKGYNDIEKGNVHDAAIAFRRFRFNTINDKKPSG